MKMYNHRNNTNRAWAFTLTLLLIFTALFGGFSPLGISGEVDEAYAAVDPPIRTATLDLTTGSGITIDAISTEGWGWAWDGTTTPMILTLSGINLSTASEAGIIVPSGTSIVVTGTNTVVAANTTAAAAVAGIYSLGDLTITGDGILTVTGGATTSGNSYGIQLPTSSSDLTISGAGLTVNAKGGSSQSYSYGIRSNDFTISVGTVTAMGGSGWISQGISVDNFTISSGTVTATGDDNTDWSYGISASTTTINGGTVTATGGTANVRSFGISGTDFTVSNGTVTATGGTALRSYGIRISDTCNISGGTINTTGGTATEYSQGIFVNRTQADAVLTISGGTVTATATSGATTISAIRFDNLTMGDGVMITSPVGAGPDATNTFIATVSSGAIPALIVTIIPKPILSIANQIMTPLTVGYNPGTQDLKTITVEINGSTEVTNLETTLSGVNASDFSITQPTSTTLNETTTSTSFTLKAKDELSAGTYTATVSITATSMNAMSFTVTQVVNVEGGSGGSGGSGGGSTPTTVINTNTGSVTENQLKNAAGAAKTGDTVTIQSNRTSEVIFPASGLSSLAGKDTTLTVVTENGTLTFDSRAVSAMGAQATTTDLQIMVKDVEKSYLTEDQQAKVGDKKVYDLTVLSGDKLISSFEGGKVSVNIPYELETGETAEKITVWYMADDGSLTEITCTYDATTRSVAFIVDHFSKYIIGYDVLAGWVNPFHDVMNDAWYYQAVAYANARDLMKGQTNTTFGPQIAMTRGMLVTILGRMEGVDTTVYAAGSTFSDVDNHQYYAPYIAWASEKDIVNGMGEDRFAPDAAVTREQMAVMMTNYLTFKEQGPTGAWAILLTYGDLDKVSSWANEGVMFMTMKGLMKGMGDDKMGNPLFAPNATSTRAQTAQVMMNLDELLQ